MKSSIATGCVAALTASSIAFAQDKAPSAYPAKPIRFIVPFAPAGGLDITARLIGQMLTDKWGPSVVLDTRPGAATIVGTEIASKAVPDGYTMLLHHHLCDQPQPLFEAAVRSIEGFRAGQRSSTRNPTSSSSTHRHPPRR